MSNVLVTGGAGFIGSHIIDELIKKGHSVVSLDDLSGGFRDNVDKRAMFVKGSILDIKLLKKIFKKYEFDYVFHLAAYAAEGLSHFIKNFNYNNNVIGSINLINESILNNIKCFVFTSSIAVYGKNQLPMKEEMVPKPEDSYGIAKFTVEQELRASKDMFGLDYIVFRAHNVYGERQNIGDKYRNVIGIFMNNIMQDKPMAVFGDGLQTRAFSYIRDLAPVISDSIDNKNMYGEVFNIGAEKPYTILELADTIANVMGIKKDILYLDPRNEVQHAYCDHEKIRKFFPEMNSTSLEKGISNMAKWAKAIGPRKTRKFTNIEIEKNLPLSWRKEAFLK